MRAIAVVLIAGLVAGSVNAQETDLFGRPMVGQVVTPLYEEASPFDQKRCTDRLLPIGTVTPRDLSGTQWVMVAHEHRSSAAEAAQGAAIVLLGGRGQTCGARLPVTVRSLRSFTTAELNALIDRRVRDGLMAPPNLSGLSADELAWLADSYGTPVQPRARETGLSAVGVPSR